MSPAAIRRAQHPIPQIVIPCPQGASLFFRTSHSAADCGRFGRLRLWRVFPSYHHIVGNQHQTRNSGSFIPVPVRRPDILFSNDILCRSYLFPAQLPQRPNGWQSRWRAMRTTVVHEPIREMNVLSRPRQLQKEHHGQIPHLLPKRCDGRFRR